MDQLKSISKNPCLLVYIFVKNVVMNLDLNYYVTTNGITANRAFRMHYFQR